MYQLVMFCMQRFYCARFENKLYDTVFSRIRFINKTLKNEKVKVGLLFYLKVFICSNWKTLSQMDKQKRKTHTIREKLGILREIAGTNLSLRKFAASRGISESTLRSWKKQEQQLRASNIKSIKKSRNISRIKRGYFPVVDDELIQWVKDRNSKGIRVKDRFLQQQAINIRDRILEAMEEGAAKEKLKTFQASRLWCSRFKNRFNLRSRRHTTTHSLPDDFRELATSFIAKVHSICREFNIRRANILNMDQVPRYFENDKSTTIAEKGTSEILLRKSGSSHKRFTWTPFITADGKIIKKHALFSKLKLIPKHDGRCVVDVNTTGMWNSRILEKEILDAAKKARGMFDTKSDVLIILDSYAVHVKFVNEKGQDFKTKNIHFAVVPARLTGLLQPLDVCMNRSFQQYFNDRSCEYQAESLRDGSNKTKLGNIKMPSANLVTKWSADWCETKTAEQIRKAFESCGLVPREEFDIEKLHEPLRNVYKLEMSTNEWIEKYSSLVSETRVVLAEHCQVFRGTHAFLRAVYECQEGLDEAWEDWLKVALAKIDDFLKDNELTKTIYHSGEKATILAGSEMTHGFLEVFASSELFEFSVHIIEIDSNDKPKSRFMFGGEKAEGFYVRKNPLSVAWDPEYDPSDLVFVEAASDDDDSSQGENQQPLQEEIDSEVEEENQGIGEDDDQEMEEEIEGINENGENVLEIQEVEYDERFAGADFLIYIDQNVVVDDRVTIENIDDEEVKVD